MGRGRFGLAARLLGTLNSRLAVAVAASAVTALMLGGIAIGTSLPARSAAGTAATGASTQILGGSVGFVDAGDTTAFIGPGGQASIATLVGGAAWVLPAAGTLSGFNARLDTIPGGSVTFTVMLNGAASAITCAVVPPEKRCAAAGSLAVPLQGAVAVRIENTSGVSLTNVRWASLYVIPD